MQDYIEKLMNVSILVLLEWSSEDGHRCHALCAGLKVSILVLLEWSSEAARDSLSAATDIVSILVLLEWSSEGFASAGHGFCG